MKRFIKFFNRAWDRGVRDFGERVEYAMVHGYGDRRVKVKEASNTTCHFVYVNGREAGQLFKTLNAAQNAERMEYILGRKCLSQPSIWERRVP